MRDIRVTYTPQTEGREVVGVIAMVQDITERKRASAALHESEVGLRLAASAARIGTWDRDLLGKRVTLSSQARLHLGFLPHESPSFEQWMDRVHQEDRDAVAEAVNGASANPETFE